MKTLYNDYPEKYDNSTIDTLSHEYKAKSSPLSFLEKLQEEAKMQSKIMQEENNPTSANPQTTQPIPTQEPPVNYRLYSLISSNYCNLTNLFNNIIAKTSSSKREYYQELNANLRVDRDTFNDNFNTVCNMEQYNFCNYNQLIYTTISNFIDLTDNLSSLYAETSTNQELIFRLRNNAFNYFRAFINLHPIRY